MFGCSGDDRIWGSLRGVEVLLSYLWGVLYFLVRKKAEDISFPCDGDLEEKI